MITYTMLIHYDVNKPLKLFCDASPRGVGGFLVHIMPYGDEHSIACASWVIFWGMLLPPVPIW